MDDRRPEQVPGIASVGLRADTLTHRLAFRSLGYPKRTVRTCLEVRLTQPCLEYNAAAMRLRSQRKHLDAATGGASPMPNRQQTLVWRAGLPQYRSIKGEPGVNTVAPASRRCDISERIAMTCVTPARRRCHLILLDIAPN